MIFARSKKIYIINSKVHFIITYICSIISPGEGVETGEQTCYRGIMRRYK